MSNTELCANMVSAGLLKEPTLRQSIGLALTNFILSLTDPTILDIWSLDVEDMDIETRLGACRYILSTWQYDRDNLLYRTQDKDTKIAEMERQITALKADREKIDAECLQLESSGARISFESLTKCYFELEHKMSETEAVPEQILAFAYSESNRANPIKDIRALVIKWQLFISAHFNNIQPSQLAPLLMTSLPQSLRLKLPRPISWDWEKFKGSLFESSSAFKSHMEFTDKLVQELKTLRFGRLPLSTTLKYIKDRVQLLSNLNSRGLAYLLEQSNIPCFDDGEIKSILQQPGTSAFQLLDAIQNWMDRQPHLCEKNRWRPRSGAVKRKFLGTAHIH
jgi:hypothetical protein